MRKTDKQSLSSVIVWFTDVAGGRFKEPLVAIDWNDRKFKTVHVCKQTNKKKTALQFF